MYDTGPNMYENLQATTPLHIQIRILRMTLNKPLPRTHLIPHQHIEHLIRLHRLLNAHLQDRPAGRVHRRIPQRLRVHLTQTFVAADLGFPPIMPSLILLDQHISFLIAIHIMHVFAHLNVEERGLRNVEMSLCDQWLHVAEEECQQQGANVRAVNIGVTHDYDTPVA